MSKKEGDSERYYATYKRFPDTGTESSIRIGKLSSMAKCLDEAFSEIMDEGNPTNVDCDTDYGSVAALRADRESLSDPDSSIPDGEGERSLGAITIDEEFKNIVMNQFGPATSKAFVGERVKINTAISQTTRRKGEDADDELEPPAALLHGKVKYYNRFHGQWRIVVSDAEIRPRINIDYDKLKKKDMMSLKKSSQAFKKEEYRQRSKRRRTEDVDGDTDLPKVDQDGCVKIDGDLVILAYDDL